MLRVTIGDAADDVYTWCEL